MRLLRIFTALAAIVTLCAACNKSNADAHHHEDNLQVTGYSDLYEVYAEVTPLCVGHEVEILAHFTLLSTFKPLEEGTVTASLIVGSGGVREVSDKPVKPGIYSFSLKAPKAGTAKLVFDIKSKSGDSRIVIDGLKVYDDEEEAEHAAVAAVATSSNGAAFSKEMSWRIDFATEPVKTRPLGQIIKTVGQVQPTAGDTRTIVAKSAGEVTFAIADLTDGRQVNAGQALFRIDGSRMADDNLKVRLATARNDFETANAEYERLKTLAADRLITQDQLAAAKNAADNARALYDQLRAGFQGGASTATAPISGFITALNVANGQYVEAGQPLATVAQTRDLYIKADVQPSYLPYLGQVNDATIRSINGSEAYSLADLNGALVSYGRAVEGDSPLIPVTFRVNNAADFIPGTFVELLINAGEPSPVTAVPSSALLEEMGNYFVYAQMTPEYFEKREVKTGRSDGRYTEILSGVKPGERVVSRGAVLVKLSQASGALDPHAGHVH